MKCAHLIPRQRGMSLIVVMLFLVMLTILGTTAVRTSTLEEKMTGNDRDRQVAFEAAEAGLRDGEREVFQSLTTGSGFDSACTGGLCVLSSTATPQYDVVDWSSATPRDYGSRSGAGAYPVTDVVRTPRYIVELLPDMPATAGSSLGLGTRSSTVGGTPYRITAVGWGRRPTTQVMLQSVYVKP